jgi:multicomponent Na+:H+ antiporter subunit F
MTHIAIQIALALCCAGLVAAFVRLVRGPDLPDRVVALEVIALLLVGVLIVSGIASAEPAMLRAAVVVALVAFVGTVSCARYLERSRSK